MKKYKKKEKYMACSDGNESKFLESSQIESNQDLNRLILEPNQILEYLVRLIESNRVYYIGPLFPESFTK